jgi:hypothetical protein
MNMSKWMKIGGILLVAALVVTALGGLALAQGTKGNLDGTRDAAGQSYGPAWGWVDEDGDGVNDRYQADPLFVDEDGDGICDLCGSAQYNGAGYSGGYRLADGTAPQGAYSRYQADPAFVDENADGVCDNYAQYSQYSQRMMGRGRGAAGR